MKSQPTEWERLVAAARRISVDSSTSAPYGFSGRVVANAFTASTSSEWTAFSAGFSWRALSIAALIMGATVVTNFKPVWTNLSDVAASFAEPPVDTEDLSG